MAKTDRLPLHACVAPTRQVVVMMRVMIVAGDDHAKKVSVSNGLVNSTGPEPAVPEHRLPTEPDAPERIAQRAACE